MLEEKWIVNLHTRVFEKEYRKNILPTVRD